MSTNNHGKENKVEDQGFPVQLILLLIVIVAGISFMLLKAVGVF